MGGGEEKGLVVANCNVIKNLFWLSPLPRKWIIDVKIFFLAALPTPPPAAVARKAMPYDSDDADNGGGAGGNGCKKKEEKEKSAITTTFPRTPSIVVIAISRTN